MTREEAISRIQRALSVPNRLQGLVLIDEESANMAIEALSADRLSGEWVDKGEYAECSICRTHGWTQFDGIEPILLKAKFCPNCGADMRGKEE